MSGTGDYGRISERLGSVREAVDHLRSALQTRESEDRKQFEGVVLARAEREQLRRDFDVLKGRLAKLERVQDEAEAGAPTAPIDVSPPALVSDPEKQARTKLWLALVGLVTVLVTFLGLLIAKLG